MLSQKTLAGVVVMSLATAFWGVAGGVVSGLHVNGFAAAAVLELTTGILLTAIGIWSGASIAATFKRLRWWLPVLAVVEALNAAFYFAALQIAPIGLVMAIHLTSPVILSAYAIARGTRVGGRREMGSMLLVCIAIILLTASRCDVATDFALIGGMLLSLASAGCLAAFITIVARVTPDASPLLGAGTQMLVSGLILSPSLVLLDSKYDFGILLLVAVVLFAPAPWLYWKALRNINAIQAGTIQLLEPFFGSLAALLMFGTRPGMLEGVAASLVLLAAWFETGAKLPATDEFLPVGQS